MTPEQFTKLIEKRAREIQTYANLRFPTEAGNTALRFINGNFMAQGWQGNGFKPWKANQRGKRILVNKGHLRSANYYTTSPGTAIIRNTMPYAKIHNEGGTIQMKPRDQVIHFNKKGKFARAKKASYAQKARRGAYSITIPQRQFAPTQSSQSPVMNNAIRRKIIQEYSRIFKTI